MPAFPRARFQYAPDFQFGIKGMKRIPAAPSKTKIQTAKRCLDFVLPGREGRQATVGSAFPEGN